MKTKLLAIALTALMLVSAVSMSSCDIASYAQTILDRIGVGDILDLDEDYGGAVTGKLYFHNEKDSPILLESTGRLICLYSKQEGIFDSFDTGDTVEVLCGLFMESYPEQTYISKIKLIEDGDESSFTEEERERIAEVYGGFGEGSVGNNSGNISEGRLYFPENRDKALLISEKYGPNWLYVADKSMFDGFDSGDYVEVNHGAVMLSYPGQTNISKITLIEDGDVSDFTEEELALIERVME